MIRRISNRAMWAIWTAVLLVSFYGIAQLEHAAKGATTEGPPFWRTKLHSYFEMTAESMWVIGLVSSLAAIVLIGYMGSVCSRAFVTATEMQLEAIEAISRNQRGPDIYDASQ
jgi:hypothetical protein